MKSTYSCRLLLKRFDLTKVVIVMVIVTAVSPIDR